MGHHLKEILVIQYRFDNVLDVIRHIRVFRYDGLQRFRLAMNIIRTSCERSVFHIVGRQETQQFTDAHQRLLFRIAHKVGDAALAAMRIGAAQFFLVHFLVRNGLYHVRTRDEHMALLLHHEDKVRQCRRIACATRTRAQDSRNLRDYSRSYRILIEDGSISRQAVHALLYACAAGIVQGDDGGAVFQCQLLHFYNLGRIRLAQRTAMRRKVVGVYKHLTPVNLSVTGHHAVARYLFLLHAEVRATVGNELIQFIESALVQQHVDAFARRHAPGGVLLLYLVYSATQRGAFIQFLKTRVYFFSIHDYSSLISSNSTNT